MGKLEIKSGDKYGRLTIVEEKPSVNGRRYVTTKCDCGNQKNIRLDSLRQGKTTSCGCYNKESKRTHGLSYHSLYASYNQMKSRCYNPNRKKYKDYGGRGIKVCDRWLNSFENFLQDMGERPKGKTLDRINNDGNYEPNNCRWATIVEQRINQRRMKQIK